MSRFWMKIALLFSQYWFFFMMKLFSTFMISNWLHEQHWMLTNEHHGPQLLDMFWENTSSLQVKCIQTIWINIIQVELENLWTRRSACYIIQLYFITFRRRFKPRSTCDSLFNVFIFSKAPDKWYPITVTLTAKLIYRYCIQTRWC